MNKNLHDYDELGFKAGIEIHAQLSTPQKLFCHCPAILTNEDPQDIIQRKFRPVLGEMGVYDPALLIEFKKDHTIFYEVFDSICTYELDETPPFPINDEALYGCVKLAKMMNCNIVEETHVCRKNYLDGSVPCGFQRTSLVGYNGYILLYNEFSMIKEKKLPITWIYIEEDAARKDNERTKNKNIFFKLDRLGIPLIEIVTHHNLNSPAEVVSAARSLGMLIKSSGIARKGLGTLRQDINVSITEGARVELKGIQLLQLIPIAIDIEIKRQKGLIAIKKELKKRNIRPKDIPYEILDVTSLFHGTSSKIVLSALKRGEKVIMLPVPGFRGLFGLELQPNKRFGTELSDRVKSFTNLKEIIHSDEDLTKYKFLNSEIQGLTEKCQENSSAFILIIGSKEEAEGALSIVHERLLASFDGVPQETRHVDTEGISSFTRDLHGRSRLYPDTDLPSIVIDSNRVKKIEESLPELFRDRIERMSKQYSISIDVAEELVYEDRADIFEELVAKGVPTNIIITTLTQTLTMIARERVNIDNITDEHLLEVFDALKLEKFAKEAIPNILTQIGNNPKKSLIDIISESGGQMTQEELDDLILNVINDSQNLIKERGMNSFSPLMGLVMKKARGKIDGKLVSEILMKRLKKHVTR
ncbi:MAG: Glu-tRNA(Gln) amidotransferase subunit GatE [Candidatus Hodarchaeota archaeon]